MTHAPSPALPRVRPRARPLDAALRELRRNATALPVVLLIALLALPVPAGGEASGGGTGTVADAVSALVVAGCVVRLVRTRQRPLTRTAAVLLGLPVVGVTVAAFGASSAATGVAGAARYLQIFVLVPAAVLVLIRDARQFRLVAWALVALALWQGSLGVHQNLTGTGASYAGEDIRAVGTFGSTDVMGMATVVSYGIVCALALAFRPHAPRQRSAAVTCAALLTVPLALSFSRGAWIATAAACTAVLFLAGARRAGRVLLAGRAAAVVLVAGLGLGSTLLQERLGSITQVTDTPDQSVTDRYTMWAASADMWREHPVTGVGLKGFPEHRDSHASLALSSASDTAGAGSGFVRQPLLSPHNMYLLVLGEQGLLGLVALAGCGWRSSSAACADGTASAPGALDAAAPAAPARTARCSPAACWSGSSSTSSTRTSAAPPPS
ncbi:hypothetical protein SALBM135S_09601 [Streptomyces alboniger]